MWRYGPVLGRYRGGPPAQHKGRKAQSTVQLLPCAVRKEDPHSSAFTREELQYLKDLTVGCDQAEAMDVDQFLIPIAEGSQLSAQHQGRQVQSTAQLLLSNQVWRTHTVPPSPGRSCRTLR